MIKRQPLIGRGRILIFTFPVHFYDFIIVYFIVFISINAFSIKLSGCVISNTLKSRGLCSIEARIRRPACRPACPENR